MKNESATLIYSDRDDTHGMNDFEIMMQRKKDEGSKRRKRKDIDIINDNDDIIAQLLADMRNAAEVFNISSLKVFVY